MLSGKASACQCRRHQRCSSIPRSGRSSGGGNGNPPQYSCLENPMDRGAWRATVHGVTESWSQLSTHRVSGRAAQVLSYRAPIPALFKPLRAVGSSVATSHLPHKGSVQGSGLGQRPETAHFSLYQSYGQRKSSIYNANTVQKSLERA